MHILKKKKKVEKTYMKINCNQSYRYNLYLLFTNYKLLSLIFKGGELNELEGHVTLAYAQKSQIPFNTLLAQKVFSFFFFLFFGYLIGRE